MTFGQAIKTCLSRYATFTGVASRSEFWWFNLFGLLVGIAVGSIDLAAKSPGLAIVGVLVEIGFLLPALSVQCRRLRDAGFSPWLCLLNLIPYLGWFTVLLLATRPSKSQFDLSQIHSGSYEAEALSASEGGYCSGCGKMRLPGQKFCQGCGSAFWPL